MNGKGKVVLGILIGVLGTIVYRDHCAEKVRPYVVKAKDWVSEKVSNLSKKEEDKTDPEPAE